MQKLLLFDLETTGTDPYKHGIHQLSGMVVIGGKIRERFNFRVQPHAGALVDAEALKIAKIEYDTLATYTPMKHVFASFKSLLHRYVDPYQRHDKFHALGYNNAAFDNPFLRNWFTVNGDKYFGSFFWSAPIDVMVLAANYLVDERHTMSDFQLKTVAKHLGIELDPDRLHDAEYDIFLTLRIYEIVTGRKVLLENGSDTLSYLTNKQAAQ